MIVFVPLEAVEQELMMIKHLMFVADNHHHNLVVSSVVVNMNDIDNDCV
jgi:hypothetical protein